MDTMAKLTLDQALHIGIKAHKAGQFREADRAYTAILKLQPNHPEANHNMGILAVSVNKVEQALPFLKTALDSNPKRSQFWISYIDAFIKLEQLDCAKALLDLAKKKGAKGDGFDKLEKTLSAANEDYSSDHSISHTLKTFQNYILDIAIQLREIGQFSQAIDLLSNKIKQSPEDVDMLTLLSHCYLLVDRIAEAQLLLERATKIDPSSASVSWNTARLKLKNNKPLEALAVARDACKRFPDDIEGMGVTGSCLLANGEFTECLSVSNRAIEQNSMYAEALINRGLTKLRLENKHEALADLELAHRIKPHIKQIWDLIIRLKIEVQDYSEAISVLINMIRVDQNWQKGFQFLSQCLAKVDDIELVVKSYKKFLDIYPDHELAHNNLGVALLKQRKLVEAMAAFKKAVDINPENAATYNNIGLVFQDQGKLAEAVAAFKKAVDINPDHESAHNNLGSALLEQRKLVEAMAAIKKALDINPENAAAHNNIGIVFRDQGKLAEAVAAFKKAVDINPEDARLIEHFQDLAVQLFQSKANYLHELDAVEAQERSDLLVRPLYLTYTAIKAYLQHDLSKAHLYNNKFRACSQKLLGMLNFKNLRFCVAYSNFIEKLLESTWDDEPASESEVYHLGESHCLSYAHRSIVIEGSAYRIIPRITFGAKVFHFSRRDQDHYKAITKAHLVSLPQNSTIFLSFGEIDCRSNEGFITAATKLNKSLDELIDQTVKGYVEWFLNQNRFHKHRLFFINVPAPVYDENQSTDLNYRVATAITLFNNALKKYSIKHDFGYLDVYSFTSTKDGFSNGTFHLDEHHLGPKAIEYIQLQLA